MTVTLSRATRVVPLCTNADLYAAWQAAGEALKLARATAKLDPRETDTTAADAAAEQVGIEQEMRAHTLHFTQQAMRRKRWAEFVAAHPPREGDALDRQLGVDISALDEAIIEMTTSVVGPDGEPIPGFVMAEHWQDLADEMAGPQWEPFAMAVIALNQGDGSANVPFSPAASVEMRRSARTSKPRNASA